MAPAQTTSQQRDAKALRNQSEQIKEQFHRLDANKDGKLSFEELSSLLLALQKQAPGGKPEQSLTQSDLRQLFSAVDQNKDGHVQFDEFVDYIFATAGPDAIASKMPPGPRPACRFGNRCNRRDLRHWIAEIHPGDPDDQGRTPAFPSVPLQQAPLEPKEGSYKWIRFSNTPEDRTQRNSVAAMTLDVCHAGGYDFINKARPGVRLKHLKELVQGTRFITMQDVVKGSPTPSVPSRQPTVSLAQEQTALEAAVARATGRPVAVLGAASAFHPGGGFRTGGQHALEEAMCVQSSLCVSLQRALWLSQQPDAQAGTHRQEQAPAQKEWVRYIPEESAILSPKVEVFRGGTNSGYPFLEEAVGLTAVVSVAMPNRNPKVRDSPNDAPSDPAQYKSLLQAKFTVALTAAALSGATCVVVPALGCGVFANDPTEVGSALARTLAAIGSQLPLQEVVLAGVPKEFANAATLASGSKPTG